MVSEGVARSNAEICFHQRTEVDPLLTFAPELCAMIPSVEIGASCP